MLKYLPVPERKRLNTTLDPIPIENPIDLYFYAMIDLAGSIWQADNEYYIIIYKNLVSQILFDLCIYQECAYRPNRALY